MKKIKNLYFFLTGVFLAFDFTGFIADSLLPQTQPLSQKNDIENLTADWNNVGNYFRAVMKDR